MGKHQLEYPRGAKLSNKRKTEYRFEHLLFRLGILNDLCELSLLHYTNEKKSFLHYENQVIECGLLSMRSLFYVLGIKHNNKGKVVAHSPVKPGDITLRSVSRNDLTAKVITVEQVKHIYTQTLKEVVPNLNDNNSLGKTLQFVSKSSAHLTKYTKAGITKPIYVACVVAIGCIIDRVYVANGLHFDTRTIFPCNKLTKHTRLDHIERIKFVTEQSTLLRTKQAPTIWVDNKKTKK